ncbi:MAG: hypothetical protein V1858_01685 [Candidatus Gottesmanbacteria bacterium]
MAEAGNKEIGPRNWQGILKDAVSSGSIKAGQLGGKAADFLHQGLQKGGEWYLQKTLEGKLPNLNPFGATTEQIDKSLENVNPDIAKQARQLRDRFRVANFQEIGQIKQDFLNLKNDHSELEQFAKFFSEEIREPGKLDKKSRLGEKRTKKTQTPKPDINQTIQEKTVNPEAIDEDLLKKLTRERAKEALLDLMIEDDRFLFIGAEHNLGMTKERRTKFVEIGGERFDRKETVIKYCEAALSTGDEKDQEFLQEVSVWKIASKIYGIPHERLKESVNGEQAMEAYRQLEKTEELPSRGEWTAIREYLRRGAAMHPQKESSSLFAIYDDPEFVVLDDIEYFYGKYLREANTGLDAQGKKDLRSRAIVVAWKVYEDSLRRRGIEGRISRDAINIVKDQTSSASKEDKAKLRGITLLREIGLVTCRVNRSWIGGRLPDRYPTGAVDETLINDDLEYMRTNPAIDWVYSTTLPTMPETLVSHTHSQNRIRRVVGFMDFYSYSLLTNQDYGEILYHLYRYSLQTRILAMTANGVSAYGSSKPGRLGMLTRPSDIEDLAESVGNNLTLPDLVLISGIALGAEKPAKGGDFFNHMEFNRNNYHERNLRKRGIAESVIPSISWLPGKIEVINLYAEKTSIEKMTLNYGSEYPGRGDESMAKIPYLLSRELFYAWSFQKIFEAFGCPNVSLRSILQDLKKPNPNETARIQLGYLNQKNPRAADDGTVLDLCDKDLISALHLHPIEFESPPIPVGNRVVHVSEEDLTWKMIALQAEGEGWEWTTDNILDTLGNKLTLDEQEYFKRGRIEHPLRIKEKIAALALRSLSPDEFFDVIYLLATEREESSAHIYIKETSLKGREIIIDTIVHPQDMNRKIKSIQDLNLILLKFGRDKAAEFAKKYGDPEAARTLEPLINRIGYDNILALSQMIKQGMKPRPEDDIYRGIVVSKGELNQLDQLERRVGDLKQRSVNNEELMEEELELLEFGTDLEMRVLEARRKAGVNEPLNTEEKELLTYGNSIKQNRLRQMHRLTPAEFRLLVSELEKKDVQNLLLGKDVKDINKFRADPFLDSMSEDDKDKFLPLLQNLQIREFLLNKQPIPEELFLDDDELLYRQRTMEREGIKREIIKEKRQDDSDLIQRRRENFKLGREGNYGMSEEEVDYLDLFETQCRFNAIDDLERTTGRQILNEKVLPILNKRHHQGENALTDDEKQMFYHWQKVYSGEEEEWYESDKDKFSRAQLVALEHLRELLTHGNWGTLRRANDLDFPWHDLHRQFLDKTIDWAILGKLGAFGKKDEHGDIIYPLQKESQENAGRIESGITGGNTTSLILSPMIRAILNKRNPDMKLEICRKVLAEKQKMCFRYGIRLEKNGRLEPAPFISQYEDFSKWEDGEVIGDPIARYLVGDESYDPAWMKHRRWDAPDTIAGHNSFMLTMYLGVPLCPEYIKVRSEKLSRLDIMRLVPTDWDLFKTPDSDPKWFFGGFQEFLRIPILGTKFEGLFDILKKKEEGYYYGLIKSGVLSSRMAEFIIRAEGGWGAQPEAYRSWMARIGLEDTEVGEIGGEDVVQGLVGGVLANLPGIDIVLGKIPFKFTGIPRIAFETTTIGIGSGFITGLGTFIFGTGSLAVALPPIAIGTLAGIAAGAWAWKTRKETVEDLTRKGLLYDCIIPMDKLTEAHSKSISTRLGGLIPR